MPGSETPSLATYRVGGSTGNSSAHAWFIAAKSSGSASRMPTSTTSSSDAPPAASTVAQFATACRVCSPTEGPASCAVAASIPTMPDSQMVSPALTPWA